MFNITDVKTPCCRPFRPLFSLLFATATLLLASGCVSTNLIPISVQGADYEPLQDEIDLWEAAREEESLLLADVEVYDDPALTRYLDELVARLEPPGMAANREVRFRVTVLDDPTFNAFAFPNGSIYIHAGLLAQAETEDQIAAILAHEMTHVENRHMVRHERARWNRAMPIAVLSIGASLALAVDAVDAWDEGDCEEAELLAEMGEDVFDFGFKLAFRVAAKGYGRRLEREADEGMLEKLRAHGYDAGNVLDFYDRINGLGDLGDGREVLAHGLGSDVARRLRALMESETPTEPAAAVSQPLLAPEDLADLLRGVALEDERLMGR